MTQRNKLELEVNKPTEITLLYDEPIIGKSQYGEYFMYAVAVGEDEYSFFAPAEVHAELSQLRKREKAVVTKLASQRGNKIVTVYEVKPVSEKIKQPVTEETELSNEEPESTHDAFFDIMLNSYRDALEISKELNGMADPEKIAVTLFIARSKQNNY